MSPFSTPGLERCIILVGKTSLLSLFYTGNLLLLYVCCVLHGKTREKRIKRNISYVSMRNIS